MENLDFLMMQYSYNEYNLILKDKFPNNIKTIHPCNQIIEYRRKHHGNPGKNFEELLKIGNISCKSELLQTNTYYENCEAIKIWQKLNNLNIYGENIDTIYNSEHGPLPDKSLKSEWSIFQYILKKFPTKPWEENINEDKDIIFDLYLDFMKKEFNVPILQKFNLKNKLIPSDTFINYGKIINIFPRCRPENGCAGRRNISIDVWYHIIDYLLKKYSNYTIICHGHNESLTTNLKEKYPTLVSTKSITESLFYYYNSKILISPDSGMTDFARNCGLENLVIISFPYISKYNPFNCKIHHTQLEDLIDRHGYKRVFSEARFQSFCQLLSKILIK